MKMETNKRAWIHVIGAKAHNLKNITCQIPRNEMTVITGLSGSGKSSLAFDTIYAEGQRRYLETFSAYARQFLGNLERPEVDKITGLSPVISIEQKTTNKNPRSTVGTITEVYDFLRLLFARAGIAYSYKSGAPMVKYSTEKIKSIIYDDYPEKKIIMLAPLVRGRKGHYQELFERTRQKGYIQIRVDGEIIDITPGMKLDRYKNHFIEVVVDKLNINEKSLNRLKKSLDLSLDLGEGVVLIVDNDTNQSRYLSKHLMCPDTGISYDEPAPHHFSFNSPQGACPECNGLGLINQFDINKIIPDNTLSISRGAITPIGKYKNMLLFWQLEALLHRYKLSLETPVKDIPKEALNEIMHGCDKPLILKNTPLGNSAGYQIRYDGLFNLLESRAKEENQVKESKRWSKQFVNKETCPACNGQRLRKESLHFKIHDKTIAELAAMDISELLFWLQDIEKNLNKRQLKIASEILKEIRTRLQFLIDVGLNYLSLNRSARTLSGGESQRIRLATQIGSQLVNVLYILDEPSIGLHHSDNERLIKSLKDLRDKGNSIIVVEHDESMMRAADHIIDLGPGAGAYGGKIVAEGNLNDILQSKSLTADYLSGRKVIPLPEKRREGNGKSITLSGCTGNNLQNIDVEFPLGKFICITGVSGSGKSSLIDNTLYPILSKTFYRSTKNPLPFKSISGLQHIDKVIEVNQAPLGRTPRSNPLTYTGIFTDIRKLFAELPESKIRGYKLNRFSFNVKGGRCETCKGGGVIPIEMNFLPDVYVRCNDCQGKRYNKETLQVRYRGKNINDVLNLTINKAVDYFSGIPQIKNKLKVLQQVGLGYVTLGQSSTTLSGGESQRVKLATELMKRDSGKTLYILDEPTTGLHFEDIRVLLNVLNKLTDKGNTILIIEHNPDIIKSADYIIDLGPEGGRKGGKLMGSGTPEEVAKIKSSLTGSFLRDILKQNESKSE
ncbi:MAG: excinuclease ABC subunit UvrA [Bacteroidales bacterium]|jgi:excinuclease ABC subunit A|nr:excinuclease ABC subunit UvrA [Bacteroidales bacterium]